MWLEMLMYLQGACFWSRVLYYGGPEGSQHNTSNLQCNTLQLDTTQINQLTTHKKINPQHKKINSQHGQKSTHNTKN